MGSSWNKKSEVRKLANLDGRVPAFHFLFSLRNQKSACPTLRDFRRVGEDAVEDSSFRLPFPSLGQHQKEKQEDENIPKSEQKSRKGKGRPPAVNHDGD